MLKVLSLIGGGAITVLALMFFASLPTLLAIEYSVHLRPELVTITHKSDTEPAENGFGRVYGTAVADGEAVRVFVTHDEWYEMVVEGTYKLEIERYGISGGPLPEYQHYFRNCEECN